MMKVMAMGWTRRKFLGLMGVSVLMIGDAKTCRYGGWTAMREKGMGFFRTTQRDGIWWLVDPDGHPFLSKGVNHVSFHGDHCPALGYSPYHRNVQAKYGSEEKWAEATAKRLRAWNFNTIGAWSSASLFRLMPYTLILNLGARAGADWLKGTFPDVFAPKFRQTLDDIAAKECAPRKDDPLLVGYFTDNELRWGPDWRSPRHLLDDYLLSLPPDAPGKKALVDFFRKRYLRIEGFNKAWGLNLPDWDALTKLTELPPRRRRRRKNNGSPTAWIFCASSPANTSAPATTPSENTTPIT